MPSKTTVDSWNYLCAGYEVDNEGKVILLWCKICRELYEQQQIGVAEAGK